MAKIFTQSDEKKSEFMKYIADKQIDHEQSVRDRVGNEIPKFLHWALKPLATGMVRAKQRKDNQEGSIKE